MKCITFKITPSADAKPLPRELEDKLVDNLEVNLEKISEDAPEPWDSWFEMRDDGTMVVTGYTGPNGPTHNGMVTIEFKSNSYATAVDKFNSVFVIKAYTWDDTTPEVIAEIEAELDKCGWKFTTV